MEIPHFHFRYADVAVVYSLQNVITYMAKYRCEICGRFYYSKSRFKFHLELIHGWDLNAVD